MTNDDRSKIRAILQLLSVAELNGEPNDIYTAVADAKDMIGDLLAECPKCGGTGRVDINE